MDKPSSSQPSRILDALLVAEDTSRDGPHGTPNRIPLQNSNSPVLPEAGSSNLKKRARTLDLARQVQEKLMSQSGATADASFLSSSLSSSPAAHGGFQLNYDADTPIRAIDVGGHDQEERLVCRRSVFRRIQTHFPFRMADFVTRSIENLSEGLTVKEAMRDLGLQR
jgi:hypothetical protein